MGRNAASNQTRLLVKKYGPRAFPSPSVRSSRCGRSRHGPARHPRGHAGPRTPAKRGQQRRLLPTSRQVVKIANDAPIVLSMSDESKQDSPAQEDETGPPLLDAEACARILGKHVLLGLTYVKHSGETISTTQLHGIVEDISSRGIIIRKADGSTFRLPPDLRGIREAPSGVYRLRSTGENVENPDLLAEWTIIRPDA